jgi:predicted nucleic acid-binding protein
VYCFDTDVISATMRRDPPLHLVRRLAVVPVAEQFTTSITLGELVYGAASIAAIALARDLTLVTGNVRHFQRVPGLRVENWLAA